VNSRVERGSNKRDLVRICGVALLVAITVAMAFGLDYYASVQVLFVLILGELLLCFATKASKLTIAIVLSLTLVVGITSLEADNYAQYGSLKLWGPPKSITMCGSTRYFDGFAKDLDNGVGPRLQKITTTPSGLAIYGTRGCPEVPLYVQDGGNYLLYGSQQTGD
jgi:hypothetical protein